MRLFVLAGRVAAAPHVLCPASDREGDEEGPGSGGQGTESGYHHSAVS